MLTTPIIHSQARPSTEPTPVLAELQRTGDTRKGTKQLRPGLAQPSASCGGVCTQPPFNTNHIAICWAEILPCTAGSTALIPAFLSPQGINETSSLPGEPSWVHRLQTSNSSQNVTTKQRGWFLKQGFRAWRSPVSPQHFHSKSASPIGHPLTVTGFPWRLQRQNKEQVVIIWLATALMSVKP